MRNGTKIVWVVLTIGILLVITLISQLSEKDITKLNPFIPKQTYYVQVHNSDVLTEDSASDGAIEYTLPAWDEKGNAQTITFTGMHLLREGAYLQLMLKKDDVLAYQEVSYTQIPTAIQKHFKP